LSGGHVEAMLLTIGFILVAYGMHTLLVNRSRRRDQLLFSKRKQRNGWQTLSACVAASLGIACLLTLFPPKKAKEMKVERSLGELREDSGLYKVGDQGYIPHTSGSGNGAAYLFLQPDYPSTQLQQGERKKPKPLNRPKKRSLVPSIEKKVMNHMYMGTAARIFNDII
jgi:hypothetical protein